MANNNIQNLSMPNIIINDDVTKSWLDGVELEKDYIPSESKDEEYMCDRHLKYFQIKLFEWRQQLIIESDHTLTSLKNKNMQEPDDTDRAFSESDTNIELRTRERYLKLISKIDAALEKIKNKTYGYCEDTEEVIGLKRLEARPIAAFTIEAQEEREQKGKLMHKIEAED